jgi:hypothetical protein
MPAATLDDLARELEDARARGLALLDAAGPDLAARRPPSGGWSALECLEHLSATAEVSLSLVGAALAGASPAPEPPERYRARWWVGWFLRSLEPPARFKTRTRPDFVPPADLKFGGVRDAFVKAHHGMREQLEALRPYDLNRLRVRSPFAAFLSYRLFEWWLVLLAHERRHLWQAEEALKTARAASSA